MEQVVTTMSHVHFAMELAMTFAWAFVVVYVLALTVKQFQETLALVIASGGPATVRVTEDASHACQHAESAWSAQDSKIAMTVYAWESVQGIVRAYASVHAMEVQCLQECAQVRVLA
jgi:hypothetical protein